MRPVRRLGGRWAARANKNEVVGIDRAGKPTAKSLKVNAGVLPLCLMESLPEQDGALSHLSEIQWQIAQDRTHRVQAREMPHRMPE